jgi:PRTRC genetic system ThiF family protein
MNTHKLPDSFLNRQISIDLVGCGGNGCQMLTGLARLHVALLELGHPRGLYVSVWDDDAVTRANVGRQLFSMSDIGFNKADVLVNRINHHYGLNWRAEKWRYVSHYCDLLITCVDTAKSRREIGAQFDNYWLDLGNRQKDGQVILGSKKLPTVLEIFPELLDKNYVEDNSPSCSLAEALDKQDLFVNDLVSRWALHLLWTWFRTGEINCQGYFINLAEGCVTPIPILEKSDEKQN